MSDGNDVQTNAIAPPAAHDGRRSLESQLRAGLNQPLQDWTKLPAELDLLGDLRWKGEALASSVAHPAKAVDRRRPAHHIEPIPWTFYDT